MIAAALTNVELAVNDVPTLYEAVFILVGVIIVFCANEVLLATVITGEPVLVAIVTVGLIAKVVELPKVIADVVTKTLAPTETLALAITEVAYAFTVTTFTEVTKEPVANAFT